MIRGTTPQHTFTMPFEPPEGSKYRIVYAQGEDHKETILFERTGESLQIQGQTVICQLTAAETLLFDCTPCWVNGKFQTKPVKIQIGVETPGGQKLWSNILTATVDRCLRKDGVI